MTKKAWSVLVGIVAFLAMAGTITGGVSYWYSYCAVETIHETKQDEDIDLAMNQGRLALIQQRMRYLEERMWQMQRDYGCPNCSGGVLRTYQDFLREYQNLQVQVNRLTGK